MSNLLVIDLGNTNLTIGFFQSEKLKEHWRLSTDHKRTGDEFGVQFLSLLENKGLSVNEIDGIALSSVVPMLTEQVMNACVTYLGKNPLIIDSELKLNVTIGYDDPSAVGTDRIADAVASKAFFGSPACVIDFGTATTFNAIDNSDVYLGGAILPGIGLAAESLYKKAAKLTPVELIPPPSIIGRNTRHAIQSGLINGYVVLIEGMVKRFKKALGKNTIVVATGGHSFRFMGLTEAIDHIDPWLTLNGLRIIWELNR